jgi:thioredoxin reductase (NADPH)
MNETFDVVVIGAGPTGLACAIEAQKAGLKAVNVDKGCLVNSLYNYPANMVFFTTPELLEIGDIPFTTAHQKPTRSEALEYYRKVTEHYRLDVRQYENVERISGSDGDFRIDALNRVSAKRQYGARKIVIATGFYDLPNTLGIPGEQLPKVHHYYGEPHPYFDADVLVIGGRNSAAIAALELWRHGARVTMVHRGPAIHQNVKYWIKPDIENRIKNGEITAYFNSTVKEIAPAEVVLGTPQGAVRLKNDFVLALTGYHPDLDFLRSVGIQIGEAPDCRPAINAETLETNVPGVYLAGVVVAGNRTHEIFIENGRFHGREIALDMSRKLGGVAPAIPESSAKKKTSGKLQSAE